MTRTELKVELRFRADKRDLDREQPYQPLILKGRIVR